jgi:hypothetical protein
MKNDGRALQSGGGMYGFHNRLHNCLKSMAHGNLIKLKTGHTLGIPESHSQPGFLASQLDENGEKAEEIYLQIGSDVAWIMLIEHVNEMTEEDAVKMVFSYADIKLPGYYSK